MDLLHAVIFGIVEGASEFLPISSTGHLILTAKLLGLHQTEFLKSFEIIIQLGAILAVVALYWKSLLIDLEAMKRVAAAFIPTAVLGLIFYKIIKKILLGSTEVVLWALFIGGIFLIVFELWVKRKETAVGKISEIPLKTAVWIGVAQSFAMIPGVSRSAATIVGGLILGLNRRLIVEFSFLLAVPTMLAAAGLDLMKSGHDFSHDQFVFLAVGFVTSFFVAFFCIKWLLEFVKNHTFIVFGVYRIFVALFFWLIIR